MKILGYLNGRLLLILLCGFPGLVFGSQAQSSGVEGDWHGTLKAGATELRLALHITKNDDGSYKATLDCVDQGANGIPVTSISFKDSKLAFAVDSVHGSYEGTLNSQGTITGTWTQGQSLPLDFERGTIAPTEHKPGKPSDIDGAWAGTIDAGATKLRVVFHIVNTEDGLTATMDSLDQNAKGIPVTAVTRNGSSLKMEMKQLGGVFEGKIAPDLASIDGTWSQGGGAAPLLLKRVKDAAAFE